MNHTCGDCKIELETIRVIDATEKGWSPEGAQHVELHYAPLDADRAWFTGKIKGACPITGMICPQCRRISLFG